MHALDRSYASDDVAIMLTPRTRTLDAATVALRSYAPVQPARRALHMDAGAVVRRAIPRLPDGPSRFAISRARNNSVCNPLARIVAWFHDLRDTGLDSHGAEELICYLIAKRAEIWSDERLCYDVESHREQVLDGEEDVIQLRAAREVAAIPAHIEKIDQCVAQLLRLRRAAVARYEQERAR